MPGGTVFEGAQDLPFSFIWGTATCANDVISGSYPVPDGGATATLLGCAFLGLAALRRKFRA